MKMFYNSLKGFQKSKRKNKTDQKHRNTLAKILPSEKCRINKVIGNTVI